MVHAQGALLSQPRAWTFQHSSALVPAACLACTTPPCPLLPPPATLWLWCSVAAERKQMAPSEHDLWREASIDPRVLHLMQKKLFAGAHISGLISRRNKLNKPLNNRLQISAWYCREQTGPFSNLRTPLWHGLTKQTQCFVPWKSPKVTRPVGTPLQGSTEILLRALGCLFGVSPGLTGCRRSSVSEDPSAACGIGTADDHHLPSLSFGVMSCGTDTGFLCW